MKVIGLISGGKDSVYNLMRCRDYGHTVVALANLLPEDEAVDELDSYMYQTVGHQLLEAYAECAELPLFRRHIQGSSKHTGLEYAKTAGDEVEDLLSLLAFAKQQMPEIEAVSSGAIASDYQRLRVEYVCGQLRLVSLAYLWLQPQAELLQGMIGAGIEAVLVKVAALGLEPSKHLGRSLQQMQPLLHSLNRRFGCNVCGEGGEYESLTLDCPLFPARRIALDAWDVALHSESELAPVGVLHPTTFRVVDKSVAVSVRSASHTPRASVVEVPATLVPRVGQGGAADAMDDDYPVRLRICEARSGLFTASCSPVLPDTCRADESAAAGALAAALVATQQGLRDRGLSLGDAVLVLLWVREMAHFSGLNAVYSRHFPAVRPAARACVQVALPADTPIVLQVHIAAPGLQRRVLHVQSISCWAPSCIGPYSQAVTCGGLVFFAGQIGLHPPTMQLLPSEQQQIRQCFDSCQAVAVAMGVHLASSMIGMTLYTTPGGGQAAREALSSALDEMTTADAAAGGRDQGGADETQPLDTYLRVAEGPCMWEPLRVFVVAEALPRGAAAEIQPLCLSEAVAREGGSDSSSGGDTDRRSDGVVLERALRGEACDLRMVFCRRHFCLCVASTPPPDSPGRGGLEAGLHQLLAAVSEGLQHGGLTPSHAASVQLYVSGKYHGDAVLSEAHEAMEDALTGTGWEGSAPAVVPVPAVGPDAEADAGLLLHVLCVVAQTAEP